MSEFASGWSSFAKAAVLVFGGLLIVVIGGAIIGYFWWQRSGRDFVQVSQAAMEQGRTEGRSTDEDGCLRTAFESVNGAGGVSAIVQTDLRLRGCLSVARVSERFCNAVPKVTSFMESTRWQMEKCSKNKTAGSRCGMLGAVQEYCYSPERRLKVENPEKIR